MKKQIALCLLIINSCFLFAQKKTISGYVSDRKTQEKIIGAIIYDAKTKLGTITNNFGFYSLTLPSDSVSLLISYIGFTPQYLSFLLNKDVPLNIDLSLSNQLQTIEILADESERIEERTRMSTINIPIEQIKKVPAFLGEVDVLKVLQLLPGVKSGGEGSSGLYVRGGGPDQNLILLDGAPIYNASHLFGFFSTFNADAIKNVELTKGGFPARYGGRLSSVIDINMKDGNMRKYNVEGSVGLIASKILIEGPIWNEKTSFLFTARRTYLDLLLGPIISAATIGEGSGGYYFYDLNLKVNHKFSDKDKLFLSLYKGLDNFYFSTGSAFTGETSYGGYLKWGNAIGSARWNHVFNNQLFCTTGLTYTQYLFGLGQELKDLKNDTKESANYFSGINDWAGKINFDYMPNPNHNVKFGTNYIYHTFKTGAEQYKTSGFDRNIDSISGNPDIFATELNLYAEDDWRINPKLKINVGIHAAGFLVQNSFYKSLQPRFTGRYLLPNNWSVKASYASMMQFIHLLSNSNVGLPTDLWVPATKLIKPQQSYQGAFGFAKSFKNNAFEFSAEGYYKEMKNIIDYLDGANFIGGSNDWEKKVAQGIGWSYGAEFLIQKKKGKLNGWIGYTLSWTNRQFTQINEGKIYPYKYDRRHDISIVAIYKLSNKLDVSSTWVYGTGNAISLPLQSYAAVVDPGSSLNNEVQYYGRKNNYRMAPYSRMDVSVNKHKKKKWGRVTWSFGVYNLYNRQNPYFLYFARNQYGVQQLKQVSLFRLIPSISYSFKFDFRNVSDIFKDDAELEEFEKQQQ
ncbi:MAG: TonB-dependent receptor [Sphingobacteriia bacterium]|nr:TonB-dependent receptor [Candidatus Fonsibacter lacus]